MLIIGITGRARQGKNTVADVIQEACIDRYDCKQYEVSQYVLKSCKERKLLPQDLEREQMTPGDLKIMVDHGLLMRKKYPGVWIQRMWEDISRQEPQVALLPNIRFLDEATFVKGLGDPGVLIRVQTFVRDGIPFISPDRDPNSPMETSNLDIDADYFLTVKRGHTNLMKAQARALFEYIIHESKN